MSATASYFHGRVINFLEGASTDDVIDLLDEACLLHHEGALDEQEYYGIVERLADLLCL